LAKIIYLENYKMNRSDRNKATTRFNVSMVLVPSGARTIGWDYGLLAQEKKEQNNHLGKNCQL
jgi:hypothetical protein